VSFSNEEMQRYSRQIALREIGIDGQRKLKEARVCIAGMGGLGCVSASQLAAMGVGYIRLVDQDVADLTNLHRQLLYDTPSLGYPKVEVAEKRLKLLNPNVKLDPVPLTINSGTAEQVVKDVDMVIDGLDHFTPRYALNEACVKLRVPYIFGGAIQAYGNASTIIPGKTACLECMLGRVSDEGLPTCETVGVFPQVPTIVASIQAREALSLMLGKDPSLANKLLFCNLNSMEFEVFPVVKVPSCSTCGQPIAQVTEAPRAAELCGKNSFMVSSKGKVSLDMAEAADLLSRKFRVKVRANMGITFDYSGTISISLMKTGNMLVKGIAEKEGALKVYDEIMKLLVSRVCD
jgi:adenylyltransferase/sulfurtransferase